MIAVRGLRIALLVIVAILYATALTALLFGLFIGIPVVCAGTLRTPWNGIGTLLLWAAECQRVYGQAFQFFANTAQIAGALSILAAILSFFFEQRNRIQERLQQAQRDERQRSEREQRDRQLLGSLFDRAKTEVRDNAEAAAAMIRVLERERAGNWTRTKGSYVGH